ncbi:MAG: sensor histidine kinase [SAR324 cluster bacterium]|nr:sensor histidine kinase [SAR324 cluster bacterium]
MLKPRTPKLFILLGLFAALIYGAYHYGQTWAEQNLFETGRSQLELYSSSLQNTIDKYRYLPYLLSQNQDIINLLSGKQKQPDLQEKINQYLMQANKKTAASLLYVMNTEGLTLATSNWDVPDNLVGRSFQFRPYFQEAIKGKEGSFFAIGTTTKKPGYYLSHPVWFNSKLIGVVAVKISLENLQNEWVMSRDNVLVSDKNGVISLSSNPDWKYTTLAPLSKETRQQILEVKQYLGVSLETIGVFKKLAVGEKKSVLMIKNESDESATNYFFQTKDLAALGWKIHYLTNLRQVTQRARLSTMAAAALIIVLLLAFLLQRERRSKLQTLQQARDLLEHRVEERTLELQLAQEELAQSGKLAALGQMSSVVAHELNQPLTAMNTFVASSKLLIKKGQWQTVEENVTILSELIQRMNSITRQLKTFSGRETEGHEKVSLQKALNYALDLFSIRIQSENVKVKLECLLDEYFVWGDRIKVEQLLVNLIGNALDAMKKQREKHIIISASCFKSDSRPENKTALINIKDSGPGIAEEDIPKLFEPFFTTKTVGEGLGLGLSIAFGIVHELGGEISASTLAEGGAVFSVELPILTN